MDQRQFSVYIMASYSGTLYIGMTNDLKRRVYEHKKFLVPGFSQAYGCNRLIYFEHSPYIVNTIAREKQLKGWRREKKENLIRTMNPSWKDLAGDWFQEQFPRVSSLHQGFLLASE